MNSITKLSQDLEFLSKLIRSSDSNNQTEVCNFFPSYPSGENCVPQEIYFKSEFNLEQVNNLEETINTLSSTLKDDNLVNKFNSLIHSIITMGDDQIEANADHLVFMSCSIFIDRSKYKTNIQYLSRVEQLISNTKVEYIKGLKQKFLSQSNLFGLHFKHKFNIGATIVNKYTHIKHTHKVLEINSPNVVWSGSSVYHLGYTKINSLELVDLDLFIIGTPEEKMAVIDKIKSNLIELFGSQNVIYKTCGSVGYIFIKGIPRIIQLICWGGPGTTAQDVITHFDFDYLKSMIKYDEKTNTYICYSMDCAVKCVNSKAIILANPKKIKPYRLEKARSNGFDTSTCKSLALNLGPNDHYVMLRNRLAKEYYVSTSNLTRETQDLEFDLENLFGVKPSPELTLEGSFDTYAHTNHTKSFDSLSANEFKLTSLSKIFSEQKIVLVAKILSFYKYKESYQPYSQLIISIDDQQIINLINLFGSECAKSIAQTFELNLTQRTSCIVKNGSGFVPENLYKASNSYYAKILEDVSPTSMIIKLRCGKSIPSGLQPSASRDYYSYDFVPGQTYIIRGVLRGYVSKTHAGISFKLV